MGEDEFPPAEFVEGEEEDIVLSVFVWVVVGIVVDIVVGGNDVGICGPKKEFNLLYWNKKE